MNLSLYTDGGARGNPGPAAIGVLIKSEQGEVLKKYGQRLGVQTNNEAEYRALLSGLRSCAEYDPETVHCHLDSSLVVNQMSGQFKVKNDRLKELVSVIKEEIAKSGFTVTYHYIPRQENKEADALVNLALDGGRK